MENYEKIRKLGKGSFGNVHLVRDKQKNEFFAMKKVQFDINSKLNPINEVKLMSSLENCNIIRCHGYFLKKDKLYIIMEFADDGDLEKRVKEARKNSTPFAEKTILTWFTQICLALKYLHDKNILHRDIKLQNVFVMKNGLLKLGDFGISKKLENSTDLAQTSLGTPYYLSPELCSASPYGKKTDIWMLGCLLYELCALEKPFSADNISVLMQKILKEEPKPLSYGGYSPFINKLVAALLNKNQQKRPEIEEILSFREIRLEIKELAGVYKEIYREIEEIYCKDCEKLLQAPRGPENKKKSLVKPLSYSNLPGLEGEKHEVQEKIYTPHHPKASEINDKNSIINVIMKQQAKKQTVFSNFEQKKPVEEPENPEDFVGIQKGRVSFEQYLNKNKEKPEKLPEKPEKIEKNEKNEETPAFTIKIQRDSHKKFSEKLEDSNKSPIKKMISHNLDPQILTKKPQHLEIIEERSPIWRNSGGMPGFVEEEKKNSAISSKILSVSPTNLTKLKKNSPKAVPMELISHEVSSQRSMLFVEFLQDKLGEEKFTRIKLLLQNEADNGSVSQIIERKRNEIMEILGSKNAELIKYLRFLAQNTGESPDKRKTTVDSVDGADKREKDENRTERTSSGYAKLEGFQKKLF